MGSAEGIRDAGEGTLAEVAPVEQPVIAGVPAVAADIQSASPDEKRIARVCLRMRQMVYDKYPSLNPALPKQAETKEDPERVKLGLRLLQFVEKGARINFRTALSIETSIAGPDRADAIFRRNRSRYRAPEIAAAILAACQGDPALLAALRPDLSENGGLIQMRDKKLFQTRLRFPERYVITEASAFHPDPDSGFHYQRVIAADCQSVLPADRKDARRVVPLFDRKKTRPDVILEPDLYERLKRAEPATIGYIDQMCVEKEFEHLALAAAARHRNLSHIISNIDRKYPIEHMLGWAFCIQGLRLCDGTNYYLHEYEQKSISNMISLIVNEHSKRCPATVVGRVRDQKVPVKFLHGEKKMQGWLLTDWYCLDHETAHVTL